MTRLTFGSPPAARAVGPYWRNGPVAPDIWSLHQIDDSEIISEHPTRSYWPELLCASGAAYIAWEFLRAARKESIKAGFQHLWHDPWGAATVKDLYLNLLLIGSWMNYKEKSWTAKLGWGVAFAAFGSLATISYVLLQLLRAQGNSESLLLRS